MTLPYQAYVDAARAGDHAAVLACFADEARMHSPTKLTPFHGKAMVGLLFGHLFEVLEEFAFTEICVSQSVATLHFTCRIGGREAEGVDVLRFDAAGLIDDFRVMIRPLPALAALNEIMGARLAARA